MKFNHRINYRSAENFLCCRLALLGFSTDLIVRKCGLSESQVFYRLRKAGILRRDYRDGQTSIARIVIQQTQKATRRDLEERLQPLLTGGKEAQHE
jgi:alkylhydroperoxidase family enzyme